MPLHPQSIKDFPSLLEYLNTELDWDVDANDADEYSFLYTPDDLGLDPKFHVAIEEAKQIRTGEESLPVFWLKFKNKRLPVVVLRRILRAFVAKRKPGANSSTQQTYKSPDDLFFICAVGEENNRGLTLAHFRPLENNALAQLRTFGWDGRETQFHYLEKHLRELKWENRKDWKHAFIAEHGRAIRDSKHLALELAEFARDIRDMTRSLYEVENQNGALHELHKNFGALLGSTTSDQFADAVAQTVTSSLLAVRFEGHTLENVALTEIQTKIPFTNPFLTEFIEHLARIGFNSEQGVDFDDLGIEDLKAFLNAVPIEAIREKFGSTSQGQDPIIYFYETFLHAYDSKERMKRGVYYTPKPVVDFIVRSVHHLLQKELGFELGLADASKDEAGNYNVCILDPATGTGTFLVSVIETIYLSMQEQWKKQGKKATEYSGLWNEYVSQSLLPRLFGFELMMAPYTVAHLKIGLKLAEFGYEPKQGERLNVFLTNTLEQSTQLALDLPGFLSKEASEAARVKNNVRVNVVVGNPPYSGHSANENVWIRNLLRSKLPDGADSIFKVDGADLGERNPKWLNDDYVKFTRYAQLRLAQSERGVLGFITNHGYLDNPTFRGLRQSLLHTFPQMWQLDLHGNSKKKEKTPDGKPDENVFEIQQGVSLNFGIVGTRPAVSAVRGGVSGVADDSGRSVADTAGRVPTIHHADLWGTQNEKYQWCEKSKFTNAAWQQVEAKKPNYLFVPQNGDLASEVEELISLAEIFDANSMGITTGDDDELVGLTKSDFKAALQNKLQQVAYRPFDNRLLLYDPQLLARARTELTKHFFGHDNIGFATIRRPRNGKIGNFFVVKNAPDKCIISTLDNAQIFPLYLYNPPINWDTQLLGLGAHGRRANLAPGFVAGLGLRLNLQWQSDGRGLRTQSVSDGLNRGDQESSAEPVAYARGSQFGPEDVLAFIYAIFHAPSYRSRYAEFLKIDFPRVPHTDDVALFWELVECGRALIDLHLMNEGALGSGEASLAPTDGLQGEVAPGYPKFDSGKVLINASGAGFEGVSEAVWNFHIGGYQVAHKWLKDRKGRVLSDEDAAHYRRVLVALEKTIDAMVRVDEIILSHGGWPLAGSQGGSPPSDEEIKSFFANAFLAAGDAIEVPSRPAQPNVGARPASPKTPQLPKTSAASEAPKKTRQTAGEASLAPTNVRPIAEYSRDELIAVLKKVVKRTWVLREDAIRESARVLGFARTGKQIQIAFRSAINGAIRRGVLEYEGDWIRRAK